ncbi:MAG TPA: sulfatase-like hydrolase/transferase [Actinomycetota bacterium]|nr:sulfatase-like hydrolase/transferase [Actinomycetota bacterium]
MRVKLLLALTIAAAVAAGLPLPGGPIIATRSAQAAAKPNVLIIVTDDQRLNGTMAVMPKTLAKFDQNGTEFTNGFVTTPLCCPSRSTIFSGRYAHNHLVKTNGSGTTIVDQNATIQKYLQDDGNYFTGIVGKMLINYPFSQDNPPNWDRYSLTGGGYYGDWNFDDSYFNNPGDQYTTTITKQKSLEYLQYFNDANDGKPWFLYVAPQAPHKHDKKSFDRSDPNDPEYQFRLEPKYDEAPVPNWDRLPSVDESPRTDKPAWVRNRNWTGDEVAPYREEYLRTLMSVDDMVGAIFKRMKNLGENNTIAIFTSDNGYFWGEHKIGPDKRFAYTEAFKVPFYMRWPKGGVPKGANSSCFVANVDLLPTMLDAADFSPALEYPLDGHSLLGETDGTCTRGRMLLEYFNSSDSPGVPAWAAYWDGSVQYTEWYDSNNPPSANVLFREYYDLDSDPFQLVNLLEDEDAGNDPDYGAYETQLHADWDCAGTSGGNACP